MAAAPAAPAAGAERTDRAARVVAAVRRSALLGMPPGVRSTTAPILHRLRTLLVTAAALALLTSTWAFAAMHQYAASVHGRAAPAVLELTAAQLALERADGIAVDSFARSSTGDPGAEFHSRLGLAGQNLARVAEVNVAGADGSRAVQLVQGLLASYQQLVAQAQAYFQEGERLLGTAALRDASALLHADGGILSTLQSLTDQQQRTIDRQATVGWMSPLSIAGWAVPLLLLATVLVGTQRFLRRRFRRTLNPWLLPATVLLVALSISCAVLAAGHQHRPGWGDLQTVVSGRTAQLNELTGDNQDDREVLRSSCLRGCADPPATSPDATRPTPAAVDAARQAQEAERIDRLTAAPGGTAAPVLIALALLAVAALGWAGLRQPLDEYRFRQ